MLNLLKPKQAQAYSIYRLVAQPWQAKILMRGFTVRTEFGDASRKVHKLSSPLDSFPTQAEEFDAHKYKMEVMHENKNDILWFNKNSARNIFRYQTQFPDFENDNRSGYKLHDTDLFNKNEWKKRNEFELRKIDILRFIKLKESLKRKTNKIQNQSAEHKKLRENYFKGKIDPEFNLLTGYGQEEFMKLLRHKTDLKRNVNNEKMDQLVEKLDFLDYRDFLAINKYIIESKRAKEYHAFARGKILSEAVKRFTKEKLEEVNLRAEEEAKNNKAKEEVTDDIRDLKLKAIMEQNPDFEKEYRDEYLKHKKYQESFRTRYEDLHSKFDKVIEEINRDGVRRDGEDLVPEEPYSTEYSDHEMYSQKMLRWYKTSKEMRDWLNDSIEDATTKAKEREIERSFKEMKAGLEKKKKLSLNLEKIRSQIMFSHDIKKLNTSSFYSNVDPVYGVRETVYEEDKIDFKFNNPLLDAIVESPPPEPSIPFNESIDETSQQRKEFEDLLNVKYFDAKWKWYLHTKLNMMKTYSEEFQIAIETEEKKLAYDLKKVEFMHNNLSHDNDRMRVRNTLSVEMHKKATIQDIGEVLDQMIIDEKINNPDYENINPKSLTQDYMSYDLYDSVKDITHANKIKPNLFENQDRLLYDKDYNREEKYREIIDKVNSEDTKRDHSIGSLTDFEKLELQIYTTIKRDPYYKHYIFNCLRYEAEYMNSKINENALAIAADNYKLRIKFDPILIPKLNEENKVKNFIGKIAGGRAWGTGRRKTSRAVASVKPGSGKVIVNGKNLINYFLIPVQRQIIMKPLQVSKYTAILDVEVWVKGGGFMSQPRACVPAIAKAITRFDPTLREQLLGQGYIKSDGRMRERKHYGLKRARKGRVYKRR